MPPGTKLAPCSLACVLWRYARAQPQPTAIDYLNQVVLMELPKSASVAPHRLPRETAQRKPHSSLGPTQVGLRLTPRIGPLHAAHGRVEEVHHSSTRSPRCPQSVVFPQAPRSVLYGGWGTNHGPIREHPIAVHHSCADSVKLLVCRLCQVCCCSRSSQTPLGEKCATMSYEDPGKESTATLKKWTLHTRICCASLLCRLCQACCCSRLHTGICCASLVCRLCQVCCCSHDFILVFAVHHSCADSVKSAAAADRPRHLCAGVPDVVLRPWQRMHGNLEKVDLAFWHLLCITCVQTAAADRPRHLCAGVPDVVLRPWQRMHGNLVKVDLPFWHLLCITCVQTLSSLLLQPSTPDNFAQEFRVS